MSVENSNMEDINRCQHKMTEILHIGMRCSRSEYRGLPGVSAEVFAYVHVKLPTVAST